MTIAVPGTPSPPANPVPALRTKRPTWHRIYYVLAAFDVLTVCLALLLGHQLMGIYSRSVAVNAEWAARGNAYARLGLLAAAVNAPGNDIFDSHDVALEAKRLADAQRAFDAQMASVRRDLSRNVDTSQRPRFASRLDDVGSAMGEMNAKAQTIFALFTRNEPDKAGEQMASMDRTYQQVDQRIEALRMEVKRVQGSLFDEQLAAAQRLRAYEWLLAAMILLMVGAAVAYGRKLARQNEQQNKHHEDQVAQLQQMQKALATAHDGMEERVQQRTRALQASEARTRAIVATAHDAYVGLDFDGLVTDWNAQAEALFGWAAHETIGQPLHELIVPERFRAQHQQGMHHYAATGEGAVLGKLVQLPALHRDGHELPVELTISAIRTGDTYFFSAFLRDITERQRAQQELDRFFKLSLDMLCIASPDGYFIRLNPAWETTLGYTVDELMARPFLEFVHPEDREATVAVERQLLEGHETRAFENRYRCKDGSWKWLVWQAAPTPDRSLVYAAAHDITERREAQLQLQGHAARLAEAQRIGRLGTWEWDIATDTVHWSDQMYRVFGIRFADFIPTVAGYLQLVHPDDRERVQALVEESLAKREPVNFEHRTLLPDGSVRYIYARNRVLADGNGAPMKLVGTAQDVTERSVAEMALRGSEERFRLVSQATNDVIWDWDLATGLVTYNRGYRLGFAPASGPTIQQTARPMENVHPDDVARVKASLDDCLASRAEIWTEEYRMHLSDGRYAHVLDRALVQRDPAGAPLRMVGSMMDISGEKRRNEELLHAKESAERASRAKSDFLANMSHEIRTPMNGVLGTLGLLLDSELTPTQHELASLARASGNALLNLINDILDLSKIEAGKLTLEPIPFDLLGATEDVTAMMAGLAAGKNLELILRFAPETPRYVVGDPGRLRQVLVNLISNAIKFTDRGQVLLDLKAEAMDDDSVSLRIRVEDTGIGVSGDQIGRIFEKFTQADASTTRRHGGTGLGLAISAQLVEMMGGQIGADSSPGRGSTFWFRVRLRLQRNAPTLPAPPDNLAGVRVLVVDDNAITRRILHEQIISWNMRSGSCVSAEDALEVLRAAHSAGDPYRIAILDYQLPRIDGEMLGRAIKADPVLRDTVLLMLTSLGQRGDVARLKALGFAAYLGKPARQSELLAALASAWSAHVHGGPPAMVTRHALLEAPEVRHGQRPAAVFDARVLVAEDHPTNQLVASMMLRNLGCHVDLASNGRDAVEMLGHADYDVVFMDCEMPEMDGFEATAAIRSRSDAKAQTPVVAVTAQAMQGDRARCLRAGMDDYISKPVQAEAFATALRRWAPARQVVTVPARPSDGETSDGDTAAPASPRPDALDADVVTRLLALAEATDASFLAQVLTSFQRDGAERIALLRAATQCRDVNAVRRTAHALKGACANVGASQMANLARRLEALAESGSVEGGALLVEALQAEFARIDHEIRAMGVDTTIAWDARA